LAKIDLKKKLKELYTPSVKEVSVVDVPEMNFLMVDGSGNPNTSVEFQDAMQALYGLSYTIKFHAKNQLNQDYVVMPLEGLWYSSKEKFEPHDKSSWQWTVMIAQPDFISEDLVKRMIPEVQKKKPTPALEKIRFQSYHEGLSAQIMHVGPFSAEGPTVAKLHTSIKEQGYDLIKIQKKHHEIYLSSPRTAPEKMRTIIRQPLS